MLLIIPWQGFQFDGGIHEDLRDCGISEALMKTPFSWAMIYSEKDVCGGVGREKERSGNCKS